MFSRCLVVLLFIGLMIIVWQPNVIAQTQKYPYGDIKRDTTIWEKTSGGWKRKKSFDPSTLSPGATVDTSWWKKTDEGLVRGRGTPPDWMLDGSGVPYEGKRGQETNPKIVTDTVRCSNGFGVLDLNEQRGRGRLSVVPSSSNDIHVFGIVPIITDSTQAVPTYGAWINRELNQLNIQSSDASDTRLVQVSFMVQ